MAWEGLLIEVEAAEVRLSEFIGHLQKDRDALLAFVFTFCVRLDEAERRMEVLAHRGAAERLGRLLLRLAESRGTPSAGVTGEVALLVSHDELAQMAAMSRPRVTVTMGRFRRRGLVRYGRRHPLLVDVGSLAASLSGEPRGAQDKRRDK